VNPIFVRLFVEAHRRAYQHNMDALARAIRSRASDPDVGGTSLVVLRVEREPV
jgi:hypothetical protein